MKELYRQSLSTIKYTIFVNGVPTDAAGNVTVTVNSNILGNATKTTGKTGEYTMVLPPNYTSEEQYLDVTWSFAIGAHNFVITESYKVITPYIEWPDFYADFAQYSKTYDDYIEAEKVARYVINSFCGQKFGKIQATYDVEGNGNDGLILPERLLTLTDISWYEDPYVIYVEQDVPWELAADGWIIRKRQDYSDPDPVRTEFDTFKRNRKYFVEGVWGWKSVPAEIQEAAKILIGSYLCPDVTYRNKYLESIKSGDWRLQFSKQAWSGTGDANVDTILEDFRNYIAFGVI